jgi:ubiquinone/menaquinone biosynthesis C-methylase UbiE
MKKSLKDVERFWNEHLCGKHFVDGDFTSREFLLRYREFRYAKEHHLDRLIDWESATGKDLLEIGLGAGADGARWAERARSYTGVDLTDESVNASRLLFQYLGLDGRILKGNAEDLPFDDNSFDIVYSHGVLHHTPDIERAFKEVHRVLRPGGEFILMLYSKNSLNFWFRIQFYFRVRLLFEFLKFKAGIGNPEPWRSHIRNIKEYGWSYFSWLNWHHHCTDGPDCRIANIYTKSEMARLLKNAGFTITKMRKAHLPVGIVPLERLLAGHIGFYQFLWSTKHGD